MKRAWNGENLESTNQVKQLLQNRSNIALAHLYMIGEFDDPLTFRLTDWPTALTWRKWGTFESTAISRGTISSEIGFNVGSLDVHWTPQSPPPALSMQTATPYQLAQIGFFDHKIFRVWKTFMNTPGDASTLGAVEMFGGHIGDITLDRNSITFTVNNFLHMLTHHIPLNVIELTNTAASYGGARPPAGFTHIPQFDIIDGSNNTILILDSTFPSVHTVFSDHQLSFGYLAFNSGPTATLGGVWSAIRDNALVNVAGRNYNEVAIYSPLPWAPTPGRDTVYVSSRAPINQADGDYMGFPFVPAPETAF